MFTASSCEIKEKSKQNFSQYDQFPDASPIDGFSLHTEISVTLPIELYLASSHILQIHTWPTLI